MKIRTLLAAALLAPLAAFSQEYPTKPIRIVVPYPPGGGVDVVARVLSAYLPARLKQPVIVDNRAGAFGNIGVEYVAKSAPDGYTVLLNTVAQAITPSTYTRLPFDPVKDFTPVTEVARSTIVLVVAPKVSARNVKELVTLAKSQPGKLNYGSTGTTNPLHLAMELFKLSTGTDIVAIPYKGDGPMYAALLNSEVEMAVMPLSSAVNHVKAGRLRALAVLTPKRSNALPDIPAMTEEVPGVQLVTWQAMFAPAKTPRDIVARLARDTSAVLQLPEVREKFQSFGADPVGNTPEEFEATYKRDVATFGKIVQAAKIPPQD